MKYFIVSVDGNYVPPAAIGWYGVIDRMTLHKKKAYEVQKHLLFLVERGREKHGLLYPIFGADTGGER